MDRWVVGFIPHGGPNELFHISASSPQLVYQRSWSVHIKDPLLLIEKSSHVVVVADFLSRYLNGPLPYV